MFYLLVVGECMERLKNMYIVIYMYLVNEIKKNGREWDCVWKC